MSTKVTRAVFYAVLFGVVLLLTVILTAYEPMGFWPLMPIGIYAGLTWLHDRATVREASKTDLDAELRDLINKYKH